MRIAVACDDPAQVASTLQRALNLEIESRDSAYWGAYWTELPNRRIRVFFNQDPMHILGADPPEEFYFEAGVSTHRTLVDVEGDESLAGLVVGILESHYPETCLVLRSSG